MTAYFRPLVQMGVARPAEARTLAGGWGWFTHLEVLERGQTPHIIPATEAPVPVMLRLTAPRPKVAGLALDRPRIMGILNTTPDSFSDGGQHAALHDAVAAGVAMAAAGADIIDIGGESTRPGALAVSVAEEIMRTAPVIAGLRGAGLRLPLSIDTRKAAVAEAAIGSGADLVNDVSGFLFDPGLAPFCQKHALPVCVMHSPGTPDVMQQDPQYDHVLLDVFDALERQISALEGLGIPRNRVLADPGIGFGKTMTHNLTLLSRISLFHGLGTAVLVGASRKKFIGTLGQTEAAQDRTAGSLAVGLAAMGQGVQMLRVHDVAETRQAAALFWAAQLGRQI